MELMQYWKVIRKSLWIVLLIVAVGLSGTTAYTLTRPVEYESSATLLLNPAVPSALVPYVQTQVAANIADSYTQLMRTRSFAEAVQKELPFPISTEQVGRALTTRLRPNTLFYDITARMDTPERAQQLVTAIVKVFLSSNAAQQTQSQGSGNSAKSIARERLEDRLEYLSNQIQTYQNQINAVESQPSSQARDSRLLELRGQMFTLQQSETDAIVALAQLSDDGAMANSALPIDQPLPGKALSRRLLTNLGLALAVSLLIGVGIAFLRDYLDYTIRSPQYLEEVLKLTPLAAIGKVGSSGRASLYGYGRPRKHKQPNEVQSEGGVVHPSLVVLERPRSPESESFKILRTNLQFSSVDKPIRTIAVTSATPGEGKSFTACNLAIAMAQGGKRVILVDTDLRKPTVHKVFGVPNDIGFTNLVVGATMDVASAIKPAPGVENLSLITSGPLPPNPSELLSSHHAGELMAQLASQSDIVIYDTPPAAAVTDPVIIATRVDAVLLVINAGVTRRDMVVRAKQALENVGTAVVLPILNRVAAREMQGYYYYYSYYGSGSEKVSLNGNGTNPDGKTPHTGAQAEGTDMVRADGADKRKAR